ncbi:hypothetical protein QA649_33445 [Bradyrhizobium sp. CB1717]|uniref:hypothetical protein n=1 Tax=Bradyrhizobium sp. CB1717 TaxID=3039154 RepID=UPI0024B1DFA6|nr:hypothetical protein [Bradyrhizobium sp. CB1717]WFU29121.1 hypothetical protein QA649_33445 [Bradyrhizobium sp. CB1717]
MRMFEPEKSQGMMTLHSRGGAARSDRAGRASAAPDEIATMQIKANANATRRNIAGLQVHEACPAADKEQNPGPKYDGEPG